MTISKKITIVWYDDTISDKIDDEAEKFLVQLQLQYGRRVSDSKISPREVKV